MSTFMEILGFIVFIFVFFGGGFFAMKATRFFFKGTFDNLSAGSKFKSYVIPWVVAFFVALIFGMGVASVGKETTASQNSSDMRSYIE